MSKISYNFAKNIQNVDFSQHRKIILQNVVYTFLPDGDTDYIELKIKVISHKRKTR